MTCHAGSAHAAASDRAAFGWLCPSCWARVTAIVGRLLGQTAVRT